MITDEGHRIRQDGHCKTCGYDVLDVTKHEQIVHGGEMTCIAVRLHDELELMCDDIVPIGLAIAEYIDEWRHEWQVYLGAQRHLAESHEHKMREITAKYSRAVGSGVVSHRPARHFSGERITFSHPTFRGDECVSMLSMGTIEELTADPRIVRVRNDDDGKLWVVHTDSFVEPTDSKTS